MVSCTPHRRATVEAQKRIGTEIVDIIRSFDLLSCKKEGVRQSHTPFFTASQECGL